MGVPGGVHRTGLLVQKDVISGIAHRYGRRLDAAEVARLGVLASRVSLLALAGTTGWLQLSSCGAPGSCAAGSKSLIRLEVTAH
jgi:hypothetical protein